MSDSWRELTLEMVNSEDNYLPLASQVAFLGNKFSSQAFAGDGNDQELHSAHIYVSLRPLAGETAARRGGTQKTRAGGKAVCFSGGPRCSHIWSRGAFNCCSQCKYAWLVTINGFYYLYWYTQAPTDGLQLFVPKFVSLSILIVCKSAKDAYMIVIWEGGRQMHIILKDELNNLLLALDVTCFANNSATKWIMHPDETMCLQVHASVAQIDFPVYWHAALLTTISFTDIEELWASFTVHVFKNDAAIWNVFPDLSCGKASSDVAKSF